LLLTGEVGLGKSTLVRRLLDSLSPEHTRSALVFNTFLQGEALLAAILRDFGLPPPESLDEGLARFNEFLMQQHRLGVTCLLVIDDAQNLKPESLSWCACCATWRPRRKSCCRSCWPASPSWRPCWRRRACASSRAAWSSTPGSAACSARSWGAISTSGSMRPAAPAASACSRPRRACCIRPPRAICAASTWCWTAACTAWPRWAARVWTPS
jgi:hypothetical protein